MSWRVPALLVLAVLASSESPGLGSTSQLVDPHPCSQLSGFTCSTLVVPLDHHGRRPGVLRLDGAAREVYGTDDVVADMELLRQALGVERWALDGVSYGTFVAERYAVAHPAHVTRLVLDSVVPHVAGFELVPVELRAVARVLRLA